MAGLTDDQCEYAYRVGCEDATLLADKQADADYARERAEVERLQEICKRAAMMVREMQAGLSHYRDRDVLKELAKAEHTPQDVRVSDREDG